VHSILYKGHEAQDGILPKRYAELERNAIYISSITITPVEKE
jgi:hypothetical protein